MVIILDKSATEEQVEQVASKLREKGYGVHISHGEEKILLGAIGVPDDLKAHLSEQLEALPFVERVIIILKPYKFVAKEYRPEGTKVRVGDAVIGGEEVVVAAGPCSVESEEQILATARAVKAAGAKLLRGGAYKPRTLPYDFQGLGEEGLRLLDLARRETGLAIVTEVMDTRDVEKVAEVADMLQIGTRNMQNFPLLREVGRIRKPVLFKRGFAATIEEWLKAAEYILKEGNENVVLCERGIRSFDNEYTRNCLDLNAVPVLRDLTHLPVAIDPSHGTGRRPYVIPLSRAAIAVGADMLLVEVHPNPAEAKSDGAQSLNLAEFERLMREIRPIAQAIGRRVGP